MHKDPQSLLTVVLERFVVLAGLWTITCNLVVWSGGSLSHLRWVAIATVAAAVGLLTAKPHLERYSLPAENAPRARSARFRWELKAMAALAIAAGYAVTGSLTLFWGLGVAFLVVCYWDVPGRDQPQPGHSRLPWVGLGLLAVLASLLTLFLHRPDIDDAFYLNLAVDAVAHPERPLLAEDWMHGEQGWPLLAEFYRITSFELGVATLASWAGSVVAWYYLVLPTLATLLMVAVYWSVLRENVTPTLATGGTAVALLAVLVWGEPHTSYGNFGFVRIFQGKGLLVSLGVPLVLLFALRWMARRDAWSWLLLALAQVACMGFSSTGLLIAPLLTGAVLLGSWRPNRPATVAALVGLSTSTWVVLAALVVAQNATAALLQDESMTTARSLAAVLGDGPRAWLGLGSLLILGAVLATADRQRAMLGYLLVVTILLANPWGGSWMSTRVNILASRMFWAIPIPLLIGLLAALLVASGRIGRAAAVFIVLALLIAPGNWTTSPANRTWFGWPELKVAIEREAAAVAIQQTPTNGLIAAPYSVSAWIPTLPRDVRTIGVRPQYLTELVQRELGGQAAFERFAYQEFLEGRSHHEDILDYVFVWTRDWGIDTVVVPDTLVAREGLEQQLGKLHFTPAAAAVGHRVWVKQATRRRSE